MIRIVPLSAVVFAASSLVGMQLAGAQDIPDDARVVLLAARGTVENLPPDSIWPGFHPDTIPTTYVLRDRGALLLGWEGPLPDGFDAVTGVTDGGWQPLAGRGAASTGTRLNGRGVAQVVYSGQEVPWLVATSVHEAFHVFEWDRAVEGRRFGQGENSFLVTRYPIFDAENEKEFALEGRLLAAALDAESDAAATRLAHKFIAVREARHRRLGPELAEFEQQAELNEGLAQYAGVRALELLARRGGEGGKAAAAEAEQQLGDLDGLLEERTVSFRSRYYKTGAAQGLLLDRLAGDGWKTRLMEQNLTLQDALALATGYRERELALRRSAAAEFDAEALAGRAIEAIEELRAELRARVDSALSRPGLTLVVDSEAIGGVGLCGIDPQNLLQVDDGVLFHARWVRPCAGSALQAEFTTPVLQDRRDGSLRAVIGAAEAVEMSVDGKPLDLAAAVDISGAEGVHIESPDVTLTAARADIELGDGVLRIRPLRD